MSAAINISARRYFSAEAADRQDEEIQVAGVREARARRVSARSSALDAILLAARVVR